ncbi:MAG TPA: hypothetical protein VGD21_08315 [Lysobacter sp.]
MTSFAMLGLMAFFPVKVYDCLAFAPESRRAEYRQAIRTYQHFELRPLEIDDGRPRATGWTTNPTHDDVVFLSAPRSLYELTIKPEGPDPITVADCLLGAQALMADYADAEPVLVPLTTGDVGPDRIVALDTLTSRYREAGLSDIGYVEPEPDFTSRSSRGLEWDARLWEIADQIWRDERLIYASLFLRCALERFQFRGEEFYRALRNQRERPLRVREAVDIENSIQNCYKAIEAIYGGTLPNDWNLVVQRFLGLGVDLCRRGEPGAIWGPLASEALLDKLKRLKIARDDRAAHGRIHANRRSTYYELMDYQVLALDCVRGYARHRHAI